MTEVSEITAIIPAQPKSIQPKETLLITPPLIDDYLSGKIQREAGPPFLPKPNNMPSMIMGNAEIVQTAILLMKDTRHKKGECLAAVDNYYLGLGNPDKYMLRPKIYRQDKESVASKAGFDQIALPIDDPNADTFAGSTIHAHTHASPPSLLDIKSLIANDMYAQLVSINLEDDRWQDLNEEALPEGNLDVILIIPTSKSYGNTIQNMDATTLMSEDLWKDHMCMMLAVNELLGQKDKLTTKEYEKKIYLKKYQLRCQEFLKACDEVGLAVYKLHVDEKQSTDFIFRREQIPERTNS